MKARKMFAVFVIAMFIMTVVPMASADETETPTATETVTATETATATEAATTAAATETATAAATETATATATAAATEAATATATASVTSAAYETANTAYETKKNSYESARGEYLSAKRGERIEKAKQYCAKVAGALQGYAEKLEAYIDIESALSSTDKASMKSELDTYTSWFEQATTDCSTSLNTTAKQIKEKYSELKVTARKYLCQILSARMENVITRAENVATKVQTAISNLSTAGKDVTQLNTWLSDFNTKVAKAKTDKDAAKSKCDQITSTPEGELVEVKRYISSARLSLLEAYRELKQIARELRIQSAASRVVVGGTGELTASGNGQARIRGTGTVTVSSIQAGNIKVEGNATTDCSGIGNKTEENGKTVCTGTGSATVTGTGMTVQIDGNSIQLTAKGTGTAVLKGSGTYSVCGKNCLAGTESAKTGSWKDAGATVLVETGEVS
jgi:hypothetical protein